MNPLFGYHRLNVAGTEKAKQIAEQFDTLLHSVSALLPAPGAGGGSQTPGAREFAICKTKLEEACFYAKKALALDPENQDR